MLPAPVHGAQSRWRSRTSPMLTWGQKAGDKRCQEPFGLLLGLRCGRVVMSRPRDRVAAAAHGAFPNGLARFRLRRPAVCSASVCGEFTCLTQPCAESAMPTATPSPLAFRSTTDRGCSIARLLRVSPDSLATRYARKQTSPCPSHCFLKHAEHDSNLWFQFETQPFQLES